MNTRWSLEIYLILTIVVLVSLGTFALAHTGVVCAFQIRYALSYSVAHAPLSDVRRDRAGEERQLRERFIPNTCSSGQFERIFEEEAGRWGF